jgi:hypothetical protein
VSTAIGGEPNLVAYVQSQDSTENTASIRQQLILPDYMVPFFLYGLMIDNKWKNRQNNLPKPAYQRPSSAPL